MSKHRIEQLIWVFIYGGLLMVCLSIFVDRTDARLAGWLGWGGGVVSLLGVALIYVRSCMKGD